MPFCRLDSSFIWNILLVLVLQNFYSYIIYFNQTGLGLIVFGLGLTRHVWSQSHTLWSRSHCCGLNNKPVCQFTISNIQYLQPLPDPSFANTGPVALTYWSESPGSHITKPYIGLQVLHVVVLASASISKDVARIRLCGTVHVSYDLLV